MLLLKDATESCLLSDCPSDPSSDCKFSSICHCSWYCWSTTHILSYDQFWNQTNDSFQRNRSKLLLHFSTSHYVSQINYLLFIKLSCKYKQMTRWFWSNFKLMPWATYKRVLMQVQAVVFHFWQISNFLSQCSFHKYKLVPTEQFYCQINNVLLKSFSTNHDLHKSIFVDKCHKCLAFICCFCNPWTKYSIAFPNKY